MSDINYKIVLIGNSWNGKDIFFGKLSNEGANNKNISTIGIDITKRYFYIDINKEGNIEQKKFEISFYDTVGQERYRSMTSSYFKNSEGIFLLYDITNKSSFENINYWIDSIKEVLGPTTMKDAKYEVILQVYIKIIQYII